jgi:TRAP-type C4-dicarboxylate transport system permease small subunit
MAAEQTTRYGATAAATESSSEGTPMKSPAVAKPVGGIGLGLAAIWSIVANFFRKLFGLKTKS